MLWYVNDVSLQGQFSSWSELESILQELMSARAAAEALRRGLRTTRNLSKRPALGALTFRSAVAQSRNANLRGLVLIWLDRTGPFIEDDRTDEEDDYFEYAGIDVTDGGLGEAARRIKIGEASSTFSFKGGAIDFARSPLEVDHGLPEERLGKYSIENFWVVEALRSSALSSEPPITSWVLLVEAARRRFQHLVIPAAVHENTALAREPFEAAIRNRALVLLGHLNSYMADRDDAGIEGPKAREIIENFFTGDRALFSSESATNKEEFESALTFPDPENPGSMIFAHWHGKISRRVFRLHFEWPIPAKARKLKILYFGPKITKG
jgi:hypothetical protein